ncbi:hypothetical protein OTU49_011466, partial [Cherax quadricarinatus]
QPPKPALPVQHQQHSQPLKPAALSQNAAISSKPLMPSVSITPSFHKSPQISQPSPASIPSANQPKLGQAQSASPTKPVPAAVPIPASVIPLSIKPAQPAGPPTGPTQSLKPYASITPVTIAGQAQPPRLANAMPLPIQKPPQLPQQAKPMPPASSALNTSTKPPAATTPAATPTPHPKPSLTEILSQKPAVSEIPPHKAVETTKLSVDTIAKTQTIPSVNGVPVSKSPVKPINPLLPSKPTEAPSTETKPSLPPAVSLPKPASPVNKPKVETSVPQPKKEIVKESPSAKSSIENSTDAKTVNHADAKDEDIPDTPKKTRTPRQKREISAAETPGDERRSKRPRNPANLYQSPGLDSLNRVRKTDSSTTKSPQDKLIVFFRNEHVALRNSEGTFYLCQVAQNVFRNTRKIKIRWLSPEEPDNKSCNTYKPDYYDITDFDCILTTVSLERIDRYTLRLKPDEETRINNILKRAMDLEKGVVEDKQSVDPNHPDGLDLSLYTNEDQLKTRRKRSSTGKRKKKEESSGESGVESEEESDNSEAVAKVKGTRVSTPKSARKGTPKAAGKTSAKTPLKSTAKATPKAAVPPKATPKAAVPPKATPKAAVPPKATPKAAVAPKATPKAAVPPKATPKAAVSPKTTPKLGRRATRK